MPVHQESQCPYIQNLELENRFASIHSRDGSLIWASPLWFSAGGTRQEVYGKRWLEFVFSEDLPLMLAWLADGEESTHTYRALVPSIGRIMQVTDHKFFALCPGCPGRDSAECMHVNGNWLVAAAVVEADLPELPAPPCVAADADLVIPSFSGRSTR